MSGPETADRAGFGWAHLVSLWQAETVKLLSRSSARAGLVVAVLLGLAGPLVLTWLESSAMVINGTPLSESITADAPTGLAWSLNIRNFFVLRAFVIMLGALSFAGEYTARTLREDLLRPVPRWSVVVAKWAALDTWIGLTAGLTWLVSAVLGLVLYGVEGSWGPIALGYLAAAATDAGFAAMVLAIAVLIRSVAATIAGVFLFLVLDTLLGWGLTLVSFVGQAAQLPWALEVAVQARPWLPSSAFGAWNGYTDGSEWIWQHFAALALITVGSLLVAERAFSRLDVP